LLGGVKKYNYFAEESMVLYATEAKTVKSIIRVLVDERHGVRGRNHNVRLAVTAATTAAVVAVAVWRTRPAAAAAAASAE
jgi:hypothetical protein